MAVDLVALAMAAEPVANIDNTNNNDDDDSAPSHPSIYLSRSSIHISIGSAFHHFVNPPIHS